MEAKATVSLSPLPLRYPSSSAAARCLPQPFPSLSASAVPVDLRQHKRNNISARSSSSSSSAAAATATTTTAVTEPQKEKDLVFVAGATGRVGSRAVRELIKLGFRVRAAVRSAERASSLVQSVQQLKLEDGTATSPAEKLEIVECDMEKQPQAGIVAGIGNAALVVCSIGASEKDILDVTGPYRIDYMATNNLVQAATAAKVEHFILVTSLGTNKIGFPAFLLKRAEEALIASGLPYTIVRPGGMERPTDAFKETHNLVVAAQDTYVGGQVSNLQVAELIGCMAKNTKAAYCKVVEVIAETTAPLLPMEELLSRIPSNREPPAEDEELLVEPAAAAAAASAGEAKARAEQPLSPYTAYEGLKPPSSPSPTPSASATASDDDSLNKKKNADIQVEAAASIRPLSPYTAFVDLKPPSSPSPCPAASASASASASADTNTISPAAAVAASSSALLDSNANGTPISSSSDQLQPQEKKQQPLSPYTRYEELKPPSSPTPSAPKV